MEYTRGRRSWNTRQAPREPRYLCIQRLDAAASNAIDLAFGWDPTEPVATRPLWIQRPTGNYNFFCFHDGNKNVSDVVSYQSAYGVAAHYEYAPFGAVTVAINCDPPASTAFSAASTNPFRFSSEYADDALGLVYYNYRHYDPIMGRWTSDDPGEFSLNLYAFVNNDPALVDWEGLAPVRFCNSSDLSNSGIVSEQNMDASRMQPFEMKGVEGKSILSAGQVKTSKPNIKICCKCISQNKGGPLYQLRYEGKMTVKMYLTSPNAVYKGSTRSPEGYNRTMAHERLHIQNITQKFESMVKEKIGNGDELMTREQCAEKMRGIDLKKITTEWETMLQDDMFHRGDEWDEWRENNGGKSWIDEGEW